MLHRTITNPETAMSFASETEALAKPEALLRVPVGLSSPLWGLFAGAAVSGAAWWWMTQWARPQNLEALFAAAAETQATVEPEIAALAAQVLETVEAAGAVADAAVETLSDATPEPLMEGGADATPEPLMETVAEATAEPPLETQAEGVAEPVVEALMEGEPVAEPVGGESAPISPVVAAMTPDGAAEAAPASKPRKKPVAIAPAADDLAD
jgi:hypothetical protein